MNEPNPSQNIYKIVLSPDKRLKQACKKVPNDQFGTSSLREQVGRMTATMYAYQGIGLAANQVGFDNRIVVVAKDPMLFPNTTPLVLINPVIVHRSSSKQMQREGCLSFPKLTKMRRRALKVRITAYDVNGTQFRWQAKGLAAQCIQHEIDHINGKTMFDK